MCSRISTFSRALLLVALAAPAGAQAVRHKIDLPKDSPVTLVSADLGNTTATPRGGALVMDVHAALSLRNAAQRRIRGVTLAVYAQEVTPGGKGSVSLPGLDVGPGETFPVRIDMPLLRPLGAGLSEPAVEFRLDGVLFEDLSFYGPDKLHSQRTMTVWELEARRDRQFFKNLLETAGQEALLKAMLASLARQSERTQPGVQMVRGRATNADPDREVAFAFLQLPGSPVEPVDGMARITANEAQAPRFEVRNKSNRAVRYLEVGWIVKDGQGKEFLAASVPADLNLAPGQSGQVAQDASLRFPARMAIRDMRGFVLSVEFADGTYWIPARAALDHPRLRGLVAPSPEEQRLSQVYLKKGPQALVQEVKKF